MLPTVPRSASRPAAGSHAAAARVMTVAEVVRRAITSLEAAAVPERVPPTPLTPLTGSPARTAPSDADGGPAGLADVLDLTPLLAARRRMTFER